MTPLAHLVESDVVLRDGSTIHLRPMKDSDLPALRQLLAADRGARMAGRPDRRRPFPFESGEAKNDLSFVLVGETGGRVEAVASYQRHDAASHHAEVLFAIAPPLQGRGVGTRMLEILARTAWMEDIHSFDAWIRIENEAVLRMFLDSGYSTSQHFEADYCRVTLSLAHTQAYQDRAAARSETAAAASMKSFFEPHSVAIVGAGRDRGKIGSEILHNIVKAGFTGRLTAVHPSATSIDGVRAVRRVTDVKGDLDLVVISVPAAAVMDVIDDCVAKRVKAIVIITAGFAETGADGRELEAEILRKVRRAGIRMVGPNCMGLLNTDDDVRLNATFAPAWPPAGNVAMSTQSGALGLAILDYARELNIGMSTFVSVGNKADVSSNDLVQYWSHDPRTKVILLYVESFGNPQKFAEIARRVGRRKPIIAVKAGRSVSGARAASSHTGALATSDAIVDALFRQAGVIRTGTLEELFDVAMLLANQPVPPGKRVAILTNAGGPGILAADACEANGLALPALAEATTNELRSFLPAQASVGNPVDMIASATPAQYERALQILLADDDVDSVLVIFIPPLVTKTEDVAAAVRRAAEQHPGKPVAGIFMSAKGVATQVAPIPCYQFPEAAAVALARAAEYGEWRRRPITAVPEFTGVDRDGARWVIESALARNGAPGFQAHGAPGLQTRGGWLTPTEAHDLLKAAGIGAAAQEVVTSEDAAVNAAARIGYPVVVKATGAKIIHKTELRAVIVGVPDESGVRNAWRDLSSRLGQTMTGVLVQEMVSGGVEMLVGMVQDPTFGPVMACATGGTRAELFADGQFRLHPLTTTDATDMVNHLRGAALLRGYRGAPVADEGALADALLRLSMLVGWCPEIQELDINPLLVLKKGVRAVDARIRVEPRRGPIESRRVRY